MHETLKKLGEYGVVPVVKIDKASDAASLARALEAGDLAVAEITFRTEAAEESIRSISREVPRVLLGAGTVLTVDQAKRALGAGAKFIVAPGFNGKVVDYVLGQGVPMIPGVSSPSEIEQALERGLEVLKFFPAGASGGLDYVKAVVGPYGGVQFIPTGGVEPGTMKDYLAHKNIFAVGGTWIAKDTMIAAGKFDEITKLAREAVTLAVGFELAHLGVNESGADRAMSDAETMAKLFSFAVKDGNSSTFAGTGFEFMKSPYLGRNGHIAISTSSIVRGMAYLERRGIATKPETAKEKDGKLTAIYLDIEVGGFAIHLVQR
jgi:2-dehydro-3-deoxyphosphogluconate aldolase/(4S)-4-hydroxy-2-oxoglutarate aldolase